MQGEEVQGEEVQGEEVQGEEVQGEEVQGEEGEGEGEGRELQQHGAAWSVTTGRPCMQMLESGCNLSGCWDHGLPCPPLAPPTTH